MHGQWRPMALLCLQAGFKDLKDLKYFNRGHCKMTLQDLHQASLLQAVLYLQVLHLHLLGILLVTLGIAGGRQGKGLQYLKYLKVMKCLAMFLQSISSLPLGG